MGTTSCNDFILKKLELGYNPESCKNIVDYEQKRFSLIMIRVRAAAADNPVYMSRRFPVEQNCEVLFGAQ